MTLTAEIIKGKGFSAEVVRTNRTKTATIKVVEGNVSVVTPKGLSVVRVEELLKRKTSWIKDKIRIHQQILSVSSKEYVSGESFSYLGRNYRLKVGNATFTAVKLKNGRLIVQVPGGKERPDDIRAALIQWYRTHADCRFREKAERFAKILGVTPASVGIKTFRRRWGSCHIKGYVLFNWKVIMAPNRIVEYVVVHELCHLLHHNHSPEFWQCVGNILPDYKECKEWLKLNAPSLEI